MCFFYCQGYFKKKEQLIKYALYNNGKNSPTIKIGAHAITNTQNATLRSSSATKHENTERKKNRKSDRQI